MKSPMGRFDMDVGPHYQDKLADLIRVERPLAVIETGLYKGLGAEYILQALDDNGKGYLYSIDPSPHPEYLLNPINHHRFSWIRDFSQNALPQLPGDCDMFIHDSDHGEECQTFEYEWAWDHVRKNGIIATDDPWWNGPDNKPHRAWEKFVLSHGMVMPEVKIIGNAMWIRR